jgi:HEAT repeat protein
MRIRLAAALGLTLMTIAPAWAQTEPSWNSRSLSFWIRALEGPEIAGRLQATDAITQIAIAHGGDAAGPAFAALLPNLDAGPEALRVSSAAALEQIGPAAAPAVPRLLSLLRDDGAAAVRRSAALALARIDPASPVVVTTAARALVADADAQVRVASAVLLVASGPAARAADGELRDALGDGLPFVRLYAALALAHAGLGVTAVPVVLGALDDEDPAVRAEAAGMLSDVGRDHPDVVPALTEALHDRDATVRVAAAGGLGSVGRAAQVSLPTLWALIQDPDEDVRSAALVAIRQIKD